VHLVQTLGYGSGRSGARMEARRRDSLLQKVHTGPRAHPAGTVFHSQAKSGWGVDLTARFLILPRLEMSGAVCASTPPISFHDTELWKLCDFGLLLLLLLLLLLICCHFMLGIYNVTPQTDCVSVAYTGATLLWLQFLAHIMSFPTIVSHVYVGTFRSVCAVPSIALLYRVLSEVCVQCPV
jgi:hypothetical protein